MGSVQDQDLPPAAQTIHTIHIPEPVRLSGKPTLEIIAEAVTFLHQDGIIVLDNAIDVSHLSTLDTLLSREALEISTDPSHHFNFGRQTRNMDQAPPVQADLMFKDIWNNPFASAVCSNLLGPHPVIHYANGNTALQASPSGRQPVHSDVEFVHPHFPFALVLNIPLVATSPANGSTEIWLGSHLASTAGAHAVQGELPINPALLEERRKRYPPIQPSTNPGSIIIRDIRLWHAGMPNLTPEPRVMLAFVAQPKWFQAKSKILLPGKVRGLIEEWEREEGGFEYEVEWVEGEVDHKKLSSEEVDFDTGSEVLGRWREVWGRE